MPFYLQPGPTNRTIDQHVAELCKKHRTTYRLMTINLAKAEDRMTHFANRMRVTKRFEQGEVVKLQTGRVTRSDQNRP